LEHTAAGGLVRGEERATIAGSMAGASVSEGTPGRHTTLRAGRIEPNPWE
jgi:hypothetical protein